MTVKFIGATQVVEAWKTQNSKRDYTIENGSIFKTNKWNGFISVLNGFGEWICDVECEFFKENFEVMN